MESKFLKYFHISVDDISGTTPLEAETGKYNIEELDKIEDELNEIQKEIEEKEITDEKEIKIFEDKLRKIKIKLNKLKE